jgi:hypothetical protein
MRKKLFSPFICLFSLALLCLVPALPVRCFSPAATLASSAALRQPQATPQAATLIINEYLADVPGANAADLAGDANGDGSRSASQDEFVELVNTGLLPLNISGFTISDATQVRYTIPSGKIIPAGDAAVIFGGGTPTGTFGNAAANGLVFAIGGGGLSLNNGADSIIVKDPSGNEVARRDYPASDGSADQSITRSPDISGLFVRHSTAAGSNGARFSPGTHINGTAFSDGPRLAQITPDKILQSNEPFALAVLGRNFNPSSQVFLGLAALPTDFVSDTNLIATVPANLAATPGNHFVQVINPDGNHSNALTLMIIAPPPVLADLSPRFIEIGSGTLTLRLQGNHFTSFSKALIEGAQVTTFFGSTRELFATVPASFTSVLGPRRVRVRNGDGQLSGELSFDVISRSPRLVSLLPAQALAASPAFTLTVTGANFNIGSVVSFQQTLLNTKFLSSSSLTAEVPAVLIAEVGLKAVVVQNSDGALSNELAFRAIAVAPLLSLSQPDRAIEGSPDQRLVILGERFKRGARVRALRNSQITLLDTIFISSERLEANLPASLLQTANDLFLQVENPDFGLSNEFAFKVFIKDPLVINEYLADPPDTLAGDANGDGSRSSSQDEFIEIVNRTNEAKDLSGYRLSDADAVRHVFAPATIIPPFEALVVFGGGKPQGRFGNAMENRLVFTASTGGLSLNNGGDTIKLEDPGGRLVQEIKFGASEGNAGESINRNPDIDGSLFTTHQRVTGYDRLFSPGAKAGGEAFTVRPEIKALAPATVKAGSATFALMITGENFQPGAVARFGQASVPTLYHSDTEIEARVGDELLLEGGIVEVVVQNPQGEVSGKATFAIFDDPPHLVSLSPKKTGTGAANLDIIIHGERLQRGASVLIANEKVATKFVQTAGEANALQATAPEKFFTIARDLEIRVVNGDANLSNVLMLAVENGPLITRVSRPKLKAGKGEVEISVSGVAFHPDIVLFVDDQAVETRFTNDVSFTARLPAEMTRVVGELILQARHQDGGRSNRFPIKVVE